jgi:hypothetical protein
MMVRIVRLAGLVLFVAAFFLPAVRNGGDAGAGSGPIVGYVCAMFAGAASASIVHPVSAWQGKDMAGALCLMLSGWVNALVPIYLLFTFWSRLVVIRRVLAAAILICFAATWVFFAKAPMVPLIGHFLWVAGALLILAGEIVPRAPKKNIKEL